MAPLAETLLRTLEPLRTSAIAALLEAQTRALAAGAEIEPEPVRRTSSGGVRRSGSLRLPSRGDLAITMDGRTLIQRVEGRQTGKFAPLEVRLNGGFRAVLCPFRWEDAPLTLPGSPRAPNWMPLRRWFLEWFQRRAGALAPELTSTVHSLEGPAETAMGQRFYIDFGSAPVDAVPGLFAALAETGCAGAVLGDSDLAGHRTV